LSFLNEIFDKNWDNYIEVPIRTDKQRISCERMTMTKNENEKMTGAKI